MPLPRCESHRKCSRTFELPHVVNFGDWFAIEGDVEKFGNVLGQKFKKLAGRHTQDLKEIKLAAMLNWKAPKGTQKSETSWCFCKREQMILWFHCFVIQQKVKPG